MGTADVTIDITGTPVRHTFTVLQRIMYDALIGWDFFEENEAIIDTRRRTLTMHGQTTKLQTMMDVRGVKGTASLISNVNFYQIQKR